MLIKLNQIVIYALWTLFLSLILYPIYISILRKMKAGKTIREVSVTGEKSEIFSKLHGHKQGTPTMWGWLFILVMLWVVIFSLCLQKFGRINNSLRNRQETYILLFGFFSMWLIGLVDDVLNIKNFWKKKWLSAKAKMAGMILFSAFISRWFFTKLGIDYINLRPIAGKVHLWLFFPIITFFSTITIVNAINITDGLDGLAWGLMSCIFLVLGVITFFNGTYIATTIIAIIIALLMSFMFFNIYPAKIFMWDSGAFAMWGLLAVLLYMLNMRIGILVPFLILFLIFIVEILSSFLQIRWKKIFKRKLFPVAPIHHLFEHRWIHESTIVMKAWFIQAILATITIIIVFYQINTLILD